ncbi:MAG: alpha/beta hydrolase [Mastigocoleus sp.]
MEQVKVWEEYYARFNIDKGQIRGGCHPRIFSHQGQQENGIVLIHGLTDSPYFLQEIGEYFHSHMQFNVYIPLLAAHGLKQPQGMKDASLKAWKEEVLFAVSEAQKSCKNVSIGGFSTGGSLSVYTALNFPEQIKGGVFLFSAALDLAKEAGNLFEIILRSPLANIQDYLEDAGFNLARFNPLNFNSFNFNFFNQSDGLIDDSPDGNPYRYSRIDTGAAQQLSYLIREIEQLTELPGKKKSLIQPVFAVHSESDDIADINGVKELIDKSQKAQLFRIGKNFFVPHTSVLLKSIVKSPNGSPLEPSNPFFDEMMESIYGFAKKYSILK